MPFKGWQLCALLVAPSQGPDLGGTIPRDHLWLGDAVAVSLVMGWASTGACWDTLTANALCYHQRLLAGFGSHVDKQSIWEEGSVHALLGIRRGNR